MAQRRAVERRRELREQRIALIKPWLEKMRSEGLTSYIEMAAALDELGLKPPRGKRWSVRTLRQYDRQDT